MTRKNKKRKQDKSSGFIIPLPFAAVLVAVCMSGLSYVWLGIRCDAMGDELKRLEAVRLELRRRRAYEEAKWVRMTSPDELRNALGRHRLDMDWPSQDRVIRLTADDMKPGRSQVHRDGIAMND